MNSELYSVYKRVMTWFGDIMLATSPPKTKAEQILAMAPYLVKGNVICRYYTYYLDGIFIPGEFTHSSIVAGKDKVVHSVAEGVQIIHPIDFVKDTDGFLIGKPDYPESGADRAVDRALWHIDNKSEYDFLFNEPNKVYCHELTADCLRYGGIDIMRTKKTFGIFPFQFTKVIYLADNIIRKCRTEYVFRG